MRFSPQVWLAILNEWEWLHSIEWVIYYGPNTTVDVWEDYLEGDRRWYFYMKEVQMMILMMNIIEENSERMYYS